MGACASVYQQNEHSAPFANHGWNTANTDLVVTEFDSFESFETISDAKVGCGSTASSPGEPLFIHESADVRFGIEDAEASCIPRRSSTFKKLPTVYNPDFPRLYHLDRDGFLLQTESIGSIQFGIPPESIKDCMNYGLEVPTFYVIHGEMFDRNCGLSTAEFEFPLYFNYFVKKRKVTILTTQGLEERIRTAFQETLFGPTPENLKFEQDFASTLRKSAWPNFCGEGIGLDGARNTLKLEDLLEFLPFNEYAENKLNDSISIRLIKESNQKGSFINVFRVLEKGQCIAKIPSKIKISPPQVPRLTSCAYKPPLFGVTVLGSSHGFDPSGNTTGFVLWINRAGIMVDPPPNSSQIMERMGIAPTTIEGIILTHCHADHDAGTFQKILRQRQVRLYTTTTIKESFIRKYAAITGFSAEFLTSLFDFRPIVIGLPLRLGCAKIRFFYSLHTIPCIGFQAVWNLATIAYSADTNYSPTLVESLYKSGAIGLERKKQLLSFPWDSTVVLHEMGVPPIHTASQEIEKKCNDDPGLKDRLFLVHAAPNASLKFKQLKELDTLQIPVNRCPGCIEKEVIRLLKAQYYFRHIWKNPRLLKQIAEQAEIIEIPAGSSIVEEDEPCMYLWIVMTGSVAVSAGPDIVTRRNSYSSEAHLALIATSAAKANEIKQRGVLRDHFPEKQYEMKHLLNVSDSFGEMGLTHSLETKLHYEESSGKMKDSKYSSKNKYSSMSFMHRNIFSSRNSKMLDAMVSYGFTATARNDVSVVKFSISKVVAALLQSRSGKLVCDSLLLSSRSQTVEALQVISGNPVLYDILVDQMCIEEFLKLMHKTSFNNGDLLSEPVIIIDGSVTITHMDANGGTFRGISTETIDFQPKSGLGPGCFLGDMNSIAKGNVQALEIRAESEGSYYKFIKADFANFMKQFPGFLVQVLDLQYIKPV